MTWIRSTTSMIALSGAGLVVLAGCGTNESLDDQGTGPESTAIVIGSQDYYSNEIIAEIYAQALEARGFTVQRDLRIGQREVYLPEIENGSITLFPEYSGNLLQYYDATTTARTSDDVYAALASALPSGLVALDQAEATDQDSYNVTAAFAEAHGVRSLADLARLDTSITLAGSSDLGTRPYGPQGLASTYGADVRFTPIEDSGGPLTLKALLDDEVQLVNIFSADPSIAENDLVTLADPEGLFLASNVVPIVSGTMAPDAIEVINAISAKLTSKVLVALNSQSITEQESAPSIASSWLGTWFE